MVNIVEKIQEAAAKGVSASDIANIGTLKDRDVRDAGFLTQEEMDSGGDIPYISASDSTSTYEKAVAPPIDMTNSSSELTELVADLPEERNPSTYDPEALNPDIKVQDAPFDPDALVSDPLIVVGKGTVPKTVIAEESLATSYITNPLDPLGAYQRVHDEIDMEGYSEELETIKEEAASTSNKDAIESQIRLAATNEIDIDQVKANLASMSKKTPDDIELHRQVMLVGLAIHSENDPEEREYVQGLMLDLTDRGVPAEVFIQMKLDAIISSLKPTYFGTAGGMLSDAIPFTTTVPFIRSFNEIFPNDPLPLSKYPRGQLALEIRNRLSKLTPSERLTKASNFIDAIMSDDNPLTSTEFQKMMILQEALEKGYGTVDQWIGNAISVLDTVGVGFAARNLFKFTKGTLPANSLVSTINVVDPDAAAVIIRTNIAEDLSQATGMTKTDAMEVGIFPHWEPLIELLPAKVADALIAGDKAIANLLDRTASNTTALSAAEMATSPKVVRQTLGNVNGVGLYEANVIVEGVQNTAAQGVEGGVKFWATYGRTTVSRSDTGLPKTVPFTTVKAAIESAKELFPTALNLKVYERLPNGVMQEVVGTTDELAKVVKKGKFVFQVQGQRTHAQVLNKSDELWYGKDDVLISGGIADYFFDPASRFSKWISSAFTQGGDESRGIAKELTLLARGFLEIPEKKKVAAVALINKYASNPKMTIDELLDAAGNDKEVIAGFLSYRQTDQALYHMENRNLYNQLDRNGGVWVNSGEYQGIGSGFGESRLQSLITANNGKNIEMWNPVTKQIESFDSGSIVKLHADGFTVHKVLEPIGDIARQTDLVITQVKNIKPLPKYVLNKREGHVARYYKETYWIREVSRGGLLNGKRASNFTILKAVGDLPTANRALDTLAQETKYKGKTLEIVHDRSLTIGDRSAINTQDNIASGRMFYHKRAEGAVQGFEGLAETVDALEAVMKNIDSTAALTGIDDTLSTMKTRWKTTYNEGGAFPDSMEELLKGTAGTLGTQEVKAAQELWRHIKTTEGLMVKESKMWKDGWLSLADGLVGSSMQGTVAGTVKGSIAKLPQWLAVNSVNRIARTAAFTFMIVAAPVRQLWVQSSQFMVLAALHPLLAPKAYAQGAGVLLALAKDSSPALYKKMSSTYAKTLGMSNKEFDTFMTKFKATGLPDSVNSHDYVRNSLMDTSQSLGWHSKNALLDGTLKLGRGLKKIATVPFKVAKKGFEYGELSNLTNTFMLARLRYLAKTGKKQLVTDADFRLVAAEARGLAWDMTKTGAFRHQEGALSAVTQFFSISQKAALAMSPLKKIGNQTFTQGERVKIALGQVFLNGAAGIGFYDMYQNYKAEKDIDIPPLMDDIIVGGLYEAFINNVIGLFSDDWNDISIANDVAPLTGINTKLVDVYDAFMGNKPWLEVMAATNVYTRFRDAATTMNMMYNNPELITDQDFLDYMSVGATVFSGYSTYLKGKVGARLGMVVSSHGSPLVQTSYLNAVAQGLFGFNQRNTLDYYALKDQYGSGMHTENTVFSDAERETTEVASHLYNTMTKILVMHNDEFPETMSEESPLLVQLAQERTNKALQVEAYIYSVYDPIEQDVIWQKFSAQVKKNRSEGSAGLIENLIKMVFRGDLASANPKATLRRLQASGLYDPNTPDGKNTERSISELFRYLNSTENLSIINEQQKQGTN